MAEVTLVVQEKFADTLAVFGNINDIVDRALRRYTIDEILTRIDELRRKDAEFTSRYNADYPTTAKRLANDDAYVRHVEENVSILWETDLIEWEFAYEGIKDWTETLQRHSTKIWSHWV